MAEQHLIFAVGVQMGVRVQWVGVQWVGTQMDLRIR
jgi:hypothetical protein